MASFLDYLQQLAKGDGNDSDTGDQTQVAQSQPVPTVAGVPVTAASTPAAPVTQAPVASTAPAVAAPSTPPMDAASQAQADAGIQVTAAKAKPQSAAGFSLPLTAADQDVSQYTDPDPNASEAPHATPQQIASTKDLQGLPEHKGYLGVHGGLRTLLGTLGDAFLVQGGGKAVYAPKVQQEKESDALVGFAQNPSDAIGRLAAINPDAAIKLQSTLMNQQLAEGRINQASKKIGATAAVQGMTQLGRIARAYSQATDPSAKTQLQQVYQQARERAGLTAEDVPDLDDTNAGSIAASGTPALIQTDQKIAGQGDARAETLRSHTANEAVAQENAGSNALKAKAAMTSASRARATPNPTNASMAQGLLQKVQSGQTLTPGQESFLDRMGYGQNSKGKASAFGSSATPAAVPAAPANPQISTGAPAFKANGWLYDAKGHPIRKAGGSNPIAGLPSAGG